MRQVEFKIREINRDEFLKKLERFGAEITFTGHISTTYYDNKEFGFVESGKRLSMRTKDQSTLLTFKNKYSDLEVSLSDEYEIEVSDATVAEHMLEGMGYSQFIKFEKSRVDLSIDEVFFSFDKYEGAFSYIPEFLTIESSNEAIILYWAEELGIERHKLESVTILELINDYKDRKETKDKELTYMS